MIIDICKMSIQKKRTTAQILKKYLILFGSIILASFGLSIFFWWWFGREIFFGTTLEFDFFATLCGCLSIIGIGIALYQIAELKARKLIEDETTATVKTTNFNRESLIKCEKVKTGLQGLKKRILNDTYDATIISSYIEDLTNFRDIWENIAAESRNLTSVPFEECDNCLTSLSALINDLFQVLSEKSFIAFQKQMVIEKIRIISANIFACENKFK